MNLFRLFGLIGALAFLHVPVWAGGKRWIRAEAVDHSRIGCHLFNGTRNRYSHVQFQALDLKRDRNGWRLTGNLRSVALVAARPRQVEAAALAVEYKNPASNRRLSGVMELVPVTRRRTVVVNPYVKKVPVSNA